MGNKYIRLFACCLIVKGNRRATLVDLQRGDFIFLPLQIAELLLQSNSVTVAQLTSAYSEEDAGEISKYFDHLIKNEYAFYTDEPESFPLLCLDWKTPNHITNAIIDYDRNSVFNIGDVVNQLEQLGCATIQFRFYDAFDFSFLMQTLTHVADGIGKIRSIELSLCYNPLISKLQYLKLISLFPRVISVVIHSAPDGYDYKFPGSIHELRYIQQKITNETHCGFISPEYFRANKYFFTESLQFNSCLNRKIAVDKTGDIKNCPAMKHSFGSVFSTSLLEISHQPDFQKVWSMNKDKIEVCKDCEFRYMCTDCRAFVPDEYSKPAKCKYDPYTMSWA